MSQRKRETAAAKQAFEDYYDLGPRRNTPMLLIEYQRVAYEAGEADEHGKRIPGVTLRAVPSLSDRTLSIWCSEWKWNERCERRVTERAEQFRRRAAEANVNVRTRLAESLELQLLAASEQLDKHVEGGALALGEGTLGLRRVVDLFMSLIGDPLVERVVSEQTVRHEPAEGSSLLDQVLADPEARSAAVQLAHSLAKARSRRREQAEEVSEQVPEKGLPEEASERDSGGNGTSDPHAE